jgi:hypothetical protein
MKKRINVLQITFTTEKGLTVNCSLTKIYCLRTVIIKKSDRAVLFSILKQYIYEKEKTVSDESLKPVNSTEDAFHRNWNYVVRKHI